RVLIPGLLECPEAELVALYGPTAEKTQGIATQRGVPYAGSDYERMLEEVRPQAVVVATPNDVHYPMALAALRRGMAVCCEKPLALTVAQAEELVSVAHRAGVPTAVNFTYRSTNGTRHVERVLREGRVGEVFHFSIAFWQNIRADPAVPLGYRMLKERGGGALLDIGVHLMDTLAWWFGPLDAVCGLTRTVIPERDSPDGGRGAVSADDTASFVVRLAGGAAGTVQVSQVAHGRQNYRRFEIFGSEGSVVMEEDRTFGPQLSLARPAPLAALLPPRSATASPPGPPRPGQVTFQPQPMPPDVDVPFDDFPRFHLSRIVAALRGETTGWPTFEDGLRAQRAVAAVDESWRSRTWVSVR
ncbi:MAG TPA: Gfo/Idh/MocA family oxidoreductase, partial [Chloroflexota bacterium]|nr:Gfo/Idh/MocA family oxidoreductase [Chloroflexota bacterium]